MKTIPIQIPIIFQIPNCFPHSSSVIYMIWSNLSTFNQKITESSETPKSSYTLLTGYKSISYSCTLVMQTRCDLLSSEDWLYLAILPMLFHYHARQFHGSKKRRLWCHPPQCHQKVRLYYYGSPCTWRKLSSMPKQPDTRTSIRDMARHNPELKKELKNH